MGIREGGGKDLSEPELARALAHESREAAAEHLEDADPSQLQGDTTPASRAALNTSIQRSKYEDEHVMLTEQDQGHILEKLEDPAEVERMLLHMRSKSTFGDTMADTIL
ncbi:hypothetical protein C2E21_6126 [Chlorella sorokiniana]|uniref:Uncharacterized protein n=1 Tax=Chlorella sorokiniana TaxID=3076 RepID=A0A2P6TLC7_CHLSO|nr:hypothetical protein C2E21_6126 [Chlorella sorokiniana]|eukprot:PRW45091.1 hypothetical protein C2E21_6126 [Chlorella sorokiniana]